MYKNIGEKIKVLAKITCLIEFICFFILGVALIEERNEIGYLVIILGGLVAWGSSWLLYGFGEIISLTQKSVKQQKEILKSLGSYQEAAPKTKTFLHDIEDNLPEL